MRGFEDELLRLESRIPGFGGLFKDRNGAMVAYLTDLKQEATAKQELATLGGALRLEPTSGQDLSAGRIQFRKGNFSFSQLVDWQQAALGAIAKLPGFQAIDADESTNHVHIVLETGTAREPFDRALGALNLPPEAIDITYGPKMEALSIRDRFPNGLGGGMQIETSKDRCTLGFNVVTQTYNEVGFLTAAHCAPGAPGSGSGGTVYQNVRTNPAYAVGLILSNPQFTRTGVQCGGYTACTWADVMLVQHSNSSMSVRVVAATTYVGLNKALGSPFENAWRVNVQRAPYTYVGMQVDKVGRTTGWTRGTLASTCQANVINDVTYGPYMVLCTDRVTNSTIGPGDSGAPVFVPDPTTTYAIGILIAGGPIDTGDAYDSWCSSTSNCSYLYNDWSSFDAGAHIPRTIIP